MKCCAAINGVMILQLETGSCLGTPPCHTRFYMNPGTLSCRRCSHTANSFHSVPNVAIMRYCTFNLRHPVSEDFLSVDVTESLIFSPQSDKIPID